jgi:hypothetical protein
MLPQEVMERVVVAVVDTSMQIFRSMTNTFPVAMA